MKIFFYNFDRICWSIIGALFLLLLLVNITRASVLSDAADSLQPGEWGLLETTGWNYEFYMDTTLSGVYPIHAWMNTGKYDSNTNQVYIMGNAHGEGGTSYLMIYNLDSNAWTKEPVGVDIGAHGYDHMGISPDGVLWGRRGGNNKSLIYHPQAIGAWQETPQSGSSALTWNIALGIDYHPLWDAPFVFGQSVIQIFKNGAWRNVLRYQLSGMRQYHLIAEYNYADSAMYFGGGNNYGGPNSDQLWRVFPDSSWEAIAPAPANIGIEQGLFSFDPATGDGLLLTKSNEFYGYDYVQDLWYNIGGSPTYAALAVPISSHGVTMYVSTDQIYLYKHGELSPPDTTIPPDTTTVPPDTTIPPDTTCLTDTLFQVDTLIQTDSVPYPEPYPVFTWPDSIWMDTTLYLKQ